MKVPITSSCRLNVLQCLFYDCDFLFDLFLSKYVNIFVYMCVCLYIYIYTIYMYVTLLSILEFIFPIYQSSIAVCCLVFLPNQGRTAQELLDQNFGAISIQWNPVLSMSEIRTACCVHFTVMAAVSETISDNGVPEEGWSKTPEGGSVWQYLQAQFEWHHISCNQRRLGKCE